MTIFEDILAKYLEICHSIPAYMLKTCSIFDNVKCLNMLMDKFKNGRFLYNSKTLKFPKVVLENFQE